MGDYFQWRKTNASSRILKEVKDYNGESEITIFCSQLSEVDYPKKRDRDRIHNEWICFFEQNDILIEKLDVCSRVNQKLFNAICCQKNLSELIIKWGMYPDLTQIGNLNKLKYLSLCASAATKDLGPLSKLIQLEVLVLNNFVGTTNYSSISELINLKQLGLHSGMDNLIKLDNLNFLENMKELKNFWTTGFRLLNRDYSPILGLTNLEFLSVNMPAYDSDKWDAIFRETFKNIKENRHRPYLTWR